MGMLWEGHGGEMSRDEGSFVIWGRNLILITLLTSALDPLWYSAILGSPQLRRRNDIFRTEQTLAPPRRLGIFAVSGSIQN